MSDVPSGKLAGFKGRMVMVGFGSIGQGVLPLILRHLDIAPSQISIITADETGIKEAEAYGVSFTVTPLLRGNYLSVLDPLVGEGDIRIRNVLRRSGRIMRCARRRWR